MSDDTNEEIAMAECGSCRAIVPLNSESCPECGISFSGVSDDALGECGACHGLVPLDSTKCPHCGTIFVADDVVDVLRKWLNETGISIPTLFQKFDKDGDGRIDSSELKSGLLSLNLADLPPSQVERLIETIDEDGDGQIDLSELHETITGEHISEESKPAVVEEVTEDEAAEDSNESEEESEEDSDAPADDTHQDDIEGDEEISSDEDEELEGQDIGSEEEHDESEDDDSEIEDIDDVIDDLDEDLEDDFEEDLEEGFEPVSILQLISDAMDQTGDSPNKFFNSLDKDGNGNVSVDEFMSAIEDLIEEDVSSKDIESFLANTDDDNDGSIDIIEFVAALESLDDADDAVDEDTLLSPKKDKPFPTDLQRQMMGKRWNDIVWPLIHLGIGLFIAAWIFNGLGVIVDGSGGNVALESVNGMHQLDNGITVYDGDIYPCDKDVQIGECSNSLTPFSGESSSMPAGFYWDGILMILLGTVALLGSLAMHFAVVPGWRARSKAMKEVEDDVEEARSDDSEGDEDDHLDTSEEEYDDESEDDGVEAESADEDEDEDDDESEGEDNYEDSEEDDDDDDEGDDEIDIGSHIGMTLDDEEVFGVIVEFDDEEETVTIKEDGSGDLVTGYQEDMFLE